MATRSRKETLKYRKVRAGNVLNINCVFCAKDMEDADVLVVTKSFFILKNIYAYSSWDNQDVADHLMIIPKKHTDTLSALSSHEAIEFMDIVGSYESRGYSIWARAPQNIEKSVTHQHTHLIKLGDKKHKMLLYLQKPYVRVLK